MTSRVNSPIRQEQSMRLPPNNIESSKLPLSQTSRGCSPPLSQQQIDKNQRIEVLRDLTRLLNLVMKQEKKYKYKL